MTAMTKLLPVLLAAALAAGGQASAQGDITATITGEAAKRIPLAVPPAEAGSGVPLAQAAEAGDVLRNDLDLSGWFALLDPAGEGRIPPEKLREPGAWRAVGAAYLVHAQLSTQAGQGRFRVRLFETGEGTVLMDRTWGGALPADLRRLAHVASDAIVERLTGNPGFAQTRIAFVSRVGKAKEVFLMDYDGARVRQLTDTKSINLAPNWSPDGRRLVFLSFIGRKPTIYLLDEGGKIEKIEPKGGDLNSAPDFSPDGRTVAFSSDRDENSEIYLMDLVSKRETRLTHSDAIDTSPTWSPDGRQIAFTSDRSGGPQIYVMNADGTGERRLTFEGSYNESAAWSPDGGRIAYVKRVEGRFQVAVYDLARQQEKVVTSGRGNKENPSWSPDSRRLIFASDMDGLWSLYSIDPDGKDLRRLTKSQAATMPNWSPRRN